MSAETFFFFLSFFLIFVLVHMRLKEIIQDSRIVNRLGGGSAVLADLSLTHPSHTESPRYIQYKMRPVYLPLHCSAYQRGNLQVIYLVI